MQKKSQELIFEPYDHSVPTDAKILYPAKGAPVITTDDIIKNKLGATVVPNEIIENMHLFTPAEFKILVFIIRKTTGFNKPTDRIANSQIQKATGLCRQTIINGVKALSEKGLLTAVANGDGVSNSYTLHISGKFTKQKQDNYTKQESGFDPNDFRNLGLEGKQEAIQNLEERLKKMDEAAKKISQPAEKIDTQLYITNKELYKDSKIQFSENEEEDLLASMEELLEGMEDGSLEFIEDLPKHPYQRSSLGYLEDYVDRVTPSLEKDEYELLMLLITYIKCCAFLGWGNAFCFYSDILFKHQWIGLKRIRVESLANGAVTYARLRKAEEAKKGARKRERNARKKVSTVDFWER